MSIAATIIGGAFSLTASLLPGILSRKNRRDQSSGYDDFVQEEEERRQMQLYLAIAVMAIGIILIIFYA